MTAALLVRLVGVEDDVLPLWASSCKPLFPWVYNLVWLAGDFGCARSAAGAVCAPPSAPRSTPAGRSTLRIFVVPLQLAVLTADRRFAISRPVRPRHDFVVCAALGGA